MAQNSKICKQCKTDKDLSLYHKDITKFDGFHTYCKSCRMFIRKLHYLNNKEKTKKQCKKWRLNNRDKENINAKNWRKNNPDLHKKILIRYRQKRKQNSQYRLIDSLRQRLRISLKVKRWNKNNSLKTYLGCNREFLINYLESKFTEGMTWDNYGLGQNKWNIDHIYPLSLAKTKDELYKLQHYSNLQPLWHELNIKKSNRL